MPTRHTMLSKSTRIPKWNSNIPSFPYRSVFIIPRQYAHTRFLTLDFCGHGFTFSFCGYGCPYSIWHRHSVLYFSCFFSNPTFLHRFMISFWNPEIQPCEGRMRYQWKQRWGTDGWGNQASFAQSPLATITHRYTHTSDKIYTHTTVTTKYTDWILDEFDEKTRWIAVEWINVFNQMNNK